MKRCTKCGQEKPLEEFGRSKREKGGRLPRCKECRNAESREQHNRRMQDPEVRAKLAATRRAWATKNPEKVRDYTRKWRAANPERSKEVRRRAAKRLMEKNPNYFREWYWNNVEKERERARLVMRHLRKTRPELERANRQRYRKNNLEAVRARERENTHRRRAMKEGTSNKLAAYMAELVKEPCAYCGSTENISVDHVIPLSRGGRHAPTNLAPACISCNCSKGAKLPDEWLEDDLAS